MLVNYTIGTIVLIVLMLLLILISLLKMIVKVPNGYQYTVERLGKYTYTIKQGVHVIIPFIDNIGAKINVMPHTFTLSSQPLRLEDSTNITMDLVSTIQIQHAEKAHYQIGSIKTSLMPVIMDHIGSRLKTMSFDTILLQQKQINNELLNTLNSFTKNYGIKVIHIEISNLHLTSKTNFNINSSIDSQDKLKYTPASITIVQKK